MTKIDEIKEMLGRPGGECTNNAFVALAIGCDEGLVRRAKKEFEIERLRGRVAELESQLKSCRCNAPLPPRKAKAKAEPQRLLWEREENGEYTPFIPMLGEVS